MLEPIEDQYKQIGYVARSHGVKGEVLILPEIYAPQLFDDIDLAHIQNAGGDLIPVRIESVRVQEKNNRLSFFVKFEHVSDRTQAEELKGFSVYAANDKVVGMDEDEKQDYTSFEVTDDNGNRIGIVEDIIENPAHLILQITTDDGQQLLVPFVDEYVVSTDIEKQEIQCQNLDQLAGL